MSLSTLLIIVLSMALAFGVDLERESATRDIRRNKALIRPYACMRAPLWTTAPCRTELTGECIGISRWAAVILKYGHCP
jgi:hypothetical protein